MTLLRETGLRAVRAILWAQWCSLRNHLPRSGRVGLAFTILIGFVWYGGFAWAAAAVSMLLASAPPDALSQFLPIGLLLATIFWQIMPVALASSGVALDTRKLLGFPIAPRDLYAIEVLLRTTAAVEVILVLLGAFVGLERNRAVPVWAPFSLIVFAIFNLLLATAVRDIATTIMANKRARQIAAIVFICIVVLPQFFATFGLPPWVKAAAPAASWIGWPWTAAARAATASAFAPGILILLAWTVAAYVFGRWQFARSLHAEANAGAGTASTRFEAFFTWPSAVFRDPLAALVEKELRTLSRAPKFRMMFVMGFSFGLLVWTPIAFGPHHGGGFFTEHFLVIICVYSLMLVGDALFWNCFGFDRGAVQLYFAAPVPIRRVLLAKNIAAAFYCAAEVVIASTLTALLFRSLSPLRLAEAYAVSATIMLLFVSVGNITSVYAPKPLAAAKLFKKTSGGVTQGVLLGVYPVALGLVALAYLAWYAFDSAGAFFAVLAAIAAAGAATYYVALDSAVGIAGRRREQILQTLSRGEQLMD